MRNDCVIYTIRKYSWYEIGVQNNTIKIRFKIKYEC